MSEDVLTGGLAFRIDKNPEIDGVYDVLENDGMYDDVHLGYDQEKPFVAIEFPHCYDPDFRAKVEGLLGVEIDLSEVKGWIGIWYTGVDHIAANATWDEFESELQDGDGRTERSRGFVVKKLEG